MKGHVFSCIYLKKILNSALYSSVVYTIKNEETLLCTDYSANCKCEWDDIILKIDLDIKLIFCS